MNVAKLSGLLFAFLSVLVAFFTLGILIGEKNGERKSEGMEHKIEFEREGYKQKIYYLEKNIKSLKSDKEKLKEEIDYCKTDYINLEIRFKEMSDSFNFMKEELEGNKRDSERLGRILENTRPYLDIKVEDDYFSQNLHGGLKLFIYNRSEFPLKIVQTDYRYWLNGVKQNRGKDTDVKSSILYPNKDVYIHLTRNLVSKAEEYKADLRGGLCIKYTTLNEKDIRYWIYEVWYVYQNRNVYDTPIVIPEMINEVANSSRYCDIESTIPKGWNIR